VGSRLAQHIHRIPGGGKGRCVAQFKLFEVITVPQGAGREISRCVSLRFKARRLRAQIFLRFRTSFHMDAM
jgi:hypothetical protein